MIGLFKRYQSFLYKASNFRGFVVFKRIELSSNKLILESLCRRC